MKAWVEVHRKDSWDELTENRARKAQEIAGEGEMRGDKSDKFRVNNNSNKRKKKNKKRINGNYNNNGKSLEQQIREGGSLSNAEYQGLSADQRQQLFDY